MGHSFFLVLSYVYSKQPILGLTGSVLESCPSLGWDVEPTTGYIFTPCVGSLTSPGIDTR